LGRIGAVLIMTEPVQVGRFCVVFLHGGLMSDAPRRPPVTTTKMLVVFRKEADDQKNPLIVNDQRKHSFDPLIGCYWG
jgi:hypothetical protein